MIRFPPSAILFLKRSQINPTFVGIIILFVWLHAAASASVDALFSCLFRVFLIAAKNYSHPGRGVLEWYDAPYAPYALCIIMLALSLNADITTWSCLWGCMPSICLSQSLQRFLASFARTRCQIPRILVCMSLMTHITPFRLFDSLATKHVPEE